MRNIIFARGNFILIKNSEFLTMINKRPPGIYKKSIKKKYHSHLDYSKKNENTAKTIIIWAHKIQDLKCKEKPTELPKHMTSRINRLLYGREIYCED